MTITALDLHDLRAAAASRLAKGLPVKPPIYAVVHEWPPGSGPIVHYRRVRTDPSLAREVLALQRRARRAGTRSPYSISTDPEHTL